MKITMHGEPEACRLTRWKIHVEPCPVLKHGLTCLEPNRQPEGGFLHLSDCLWRLCVLPDVYRNRCRRVHLKEGRLGPSRANLNLDVDLIPAHSSSITCCAGACKGRRPNKI